MTTRPRSLPLDFDEAAGSETKSPPWDLEKGLMRKLLGAMGHPPIAVRLWDDHELSRNPANAEVRLRVKNRKALWGLLVNPDLHLGDAYSAGGIEVEGSLLRLIELGTARRPEFLKNGSWFVTLRDAVLPAPRENTLESSKRNIHHHYDLSNDFYRLWLDKAYMQYTCAYYAKPDMTIEEAQIAKLEHLCRKLRLKPGNKVIEAGCGWGGLARYMAEHYGAKVRAWNISHEQVAFAIQKAREGGLGDHVQYIEDDYRNITGECDVFVSVGMLEHVGVDNYRTLGGVLDRCLRPDGRALIHSIGRNSPRLMNRWIDRRVFPGAYPPTLRQMAEVFEPYEFSVLDVENLRLHYARTLEAWLERFEATRARVIEMFDERFVRAWRLYLTGSIVAFRRGDLQLFQVLFQRGRNNDVPYTREYLYQQIQVGDTRYRQKK
jgi:cyclopropane-fatty-acyl-phospholipid synthase